MPKRQPLLTKEEENKLKSPIRTMWELDPQYTAEDVARELHFGDEYIEYWDKKNETFRKELNPTRKLKPYHVYTYIQKWKREGYLIKPRKAMTMRIKPGYIYEDDPKSPNYIPLEKRLKTRYKHSPEEIEYPSYELIFQRLKDTYPILRNREGRVFTADTKYRVMIWLFYYSLLRCSELIERKRKDFETRTTKSGIEILRIHLPRKKKSNELAPKDEPFDIPLAFGGMDEVVEYLKTIKDPNERVFPFSTFVAWHRLKEVLPEYYPHYFRFAMLTELGSQPDMSINTMIQLSGLNINTIPKYLMKRDSDVDAELQSRLKRRT